MKTNNGLPNWKRILGDVRYSRLNSPLARALLRQYYHEGEIYRIPLGPLHGKKLRYRADINFHMMIGQWEVLNFKILKRLLPVIFSDNRPRTVYDVGANIGYATLWFADVVSRTGTVYAFEPAPPTILYLRDSLTVNNISNVEIIEKASSNYDGKVQFYMGLHHHSSSLDREWAQPGDSELSNEMYTVDCISLDSFAATHDAPHLIKIDIEGGGKYALPGCANLGQSARPTIIIESHTPDEDRAISDFAITCNYCAYRIDDLSWVAKINRTYPDPEGIWGTLVLFPKDRVSFVEALLSAKSVDN